MENDTITIKFDTNPSPWFNDYVELTFKRSKIQPVVNELVKECSNKDYTSSYSYDHIVENVIDKNWKEDCGSKRPFLQVLYKMITDQCPKEANWHNGHVAAARSINSKIAWMTPGFVEARRYNEMYGS